VLTFGLPWAMLALVFSQGRLCGRGPCWRSYVPAGGGGTGRGWSVLRDRQVLRLMVLLPLRDLVRAADLVR